MRFLDFPNRNVVILQRYSVIRRQWSVFSLLRLMVDYRRQTSDHCPPFAGASLQLVPTMIRAFGSL